MSWSSSRHGQGQISTMLMKKPMLRVQSERKLNFSDYQVRIKPREFNFLCNNILWCSVLFIKLKKSFVQYPISAMESRTLPPNHKRQARSDLRGASLEQTQKGFNPFFNYTHTSQ